MTRLPAERLARPDLSHIAASQANQLLSAAIRNASHSFTSGYEPVTIVRRVLDTDHGHARTATGTIAPGRFSLSGTVRRDLDKQYGALRAIDPTTGERRWEFRFTTPSFAGVLSTASGIVFDGDNEGNFMAFDARTGKNLWHYQTGSPIWGGSPMTFMLDGKQYVVVGSGTTITAFALP